jgi:hypothetical protein
MPHLVPNDEVPAFPTASNSNRAGPGMKSRALVAPRTPGSMGGEDGGNNSEEKHPPTADDTEAGWDGWITSAVDQKTGLTKLAVGGATVLVESNGTWPAAPWFPHTAENRIRYTDYSCCGCWKHEPGPKVPNWWYAAGNGWQTVYFKDARGFDRAQRQVGIHRCVVQKGSRPCGFVVTDSETCSNVCLGQGCGCWGMRGTAPAAMEEHLAISHGIRRPPKRPWASNLFACAGLLDATFCMCCQAGSQLEASKGHAKEVELGAYYCIGAPHCGRWNAAGAASCISLPVCCSPCFVAPYLSRRAAVVLGDIDEPEMISCCIALWFPCCSLAQSYRQFRREGVHPGTCLPCCDGCAFTDRWQEHDVVVASYAPQSPYSVYWYRTEYSKGGGGGNFSAPSQSSNPDCCNSDQCAGLCRSCGDCCDAGLRVLDLTCNRPCADSHSNCCSSASDYCSRNVFDSCPCDSWVSNNCDCCQSCSNGCCNACGSCGGCDCGGVCAGCGGCSGGCGGC